MGENTELRQRYARQIAIEQIGISGQKKIRESKVLVIGTGALGSMVAMQLAGAGVGKLGLADFDKIDISNLQRQFFFKTSEAGKNKVEVLSERVNELNPSVETVAYASLITSKKAEEIFGDYDFIVDATDNPESKKMTGTISQKKGKACCIGGVRDFGGQVMTFLPEDSRFEEYFGISLEGAFLPCSLGGVMGPSAALCASIQASETIKYITDAGILLQGRILFFDLLNNNFRLFML